MDRTIQIVEKRSALGSADKELTLYPWREGFDDRTPYITFFSDGSAGFQGEDGRWNSLCSGSTRATIEVLRALQRWVLLNPNIPTDE